MTDPDTSHRHNRSYVRRDGRITPAQKLALDTLWPRYVVTEISRLRDLPSLFGRDAPHCLEVGCGDGATLVALAQRFPSSDFLGVEVYRSGLGRLLQQLARLGLGNVRLIAADAEEVIDEFSDRSIDEMYLFFPDPWPKRRHAKRRLVKPEFLRTASRVLCRGGRLRIATDWPDYAAGIAEIGMPENGFLNLAGDHVFAPRPKIRPTTRFEARATRLGHSIFEFLFAAT